MAHPAVVSLMHTLDQILNSNRVPIPYGKLPIKYSLQEKLLSESLLEKLNSLLDFLEGSAQISNEQVNSLETKIRDVAYWAEDVIESRIFLSQSKSRGLESSSQERFAVLQSLISEMGLRVDLSKIIEEIDSIMEEVHKTKELQKNMAENNDMLMEGSSQQNLQLRNILPSRSDPSGQATMVGFREDLAQIRERLCNDQPKLQIIPIVGMGGIGKTTLAKNICDDSFVKYYFHICAWVTLSPQYRMRDILLSLLNDIIVVTDEIRSEVDEKLEEYVYKNLKGKRYLIVVDDLWSSEDWSHIQRLFPNDNIGSRIILTTRLKDVADFVNSSKTHHQMHFLNEEESLDLFLRKVFGEHSCPPELLDVGKKIAQKCQGLPLLIVVTDGLLSKYDKTLDFWEFVSENLSSIIAENNDWCLKILNLSYNYLPPHLKACFLYIGVFPNNHEIPVSRLVKLWAAEGFVRSHESKCLEEVAEQYVMDLVDRNLVLVCQNGSTGGKIKSCTMHDLLRELCTRMVHKEKFFSVNSRHWRVSLGGETLNRRLCIHDDAQFDPFSPFEKDVTLQSMSLVRSFVYTGWDETQLHSCYYFGCLLLRVCDMVEVELAILPDEVLQLFNLRYIAINFLDEIPPSIVLLRNLQTLIVEDLWGFTFELPEEILQLLQLRHIKVSRATLPRAFYMPTTDSYQHSVLANLETLANVQDLEMTEHFFEKIPNVKKLGIHYSTTIPPVFDLHLQKLETLKILFDLPTESTFLRSITSAPGLKKITLERGRIGWEDMTIFGMLPNLEVLKLREFAFTGPVWEPSEGEFLNLKFLQIWETNLEQWRADNSHFPRLEHLIMWRCRKLVQIPSGIGDINTLTLIEIDYSSPLAVQSAKNIPEEQQSMGNDNLQVIFHQTKERLHPLKFGVEQDEAGNFYRRASKIKQLDQKLEEVLQSSIPKHGERRGGGLKKIVLKVEIHNERERTKVLKTISTIQGVKSVQFYPGCKFEIVGTFDPVALVAKLRRRKWYADILSVGPA